MSPAPLCKVPNPSIADDDPFGQQQSAFGKQIPTVAAKPAAGGDDAMAGYRRIARGAHDVADRPMGARPSCGGRHVAVGRDPSVGNASHCAANARREVGPAGISQSTNLPISPFQKISLNPPPACRPPTVTFTGVEPAGVGVNSCLPSEYRTSKPTPTFRANRHVISTPAL